MKSDKYMNTNVSINNTTIYFIYNKNSVLSGRHVSTFTGSSSGPLRKRSKNYLYFNALRDPKCLEIIRVIRVYMTEFLEAGKTVNSVRYIEKIKNLRRRVCRVKGGGGQHRGFCCCVTVQDRATIDALETLKFSPIRPTALTWRQAISISFLTSRGISRGLISPQMMR